MLNWWLIKIKHLVGQVGQVCWKYVSREGNQVANVLAKRRGSSSWVYRLYILYILVLSGVKIYQRERPCAWTRILGIGGLKQTINKSIKKSLPTHFQEGIAKGIS